MSEISELSWEQYRYFLTRELERTAESLDRILEKVSAIEEKQNAAEFRIKLMGTIFGACGAAVLEVIVRVGEGMFWRH